MKQYTIWLLAGIGLVVYFVAFALGKNKLKKIIKEGVVVERYDLNAAISDRHENPLVRESLKNRKIYIDYVVCEDGFNEKKTMVLSNVEKSDYDSNRFGKRLNMRKIVYEYRGKLESIYECDEIKDIHYYLDKDHLTRAEKRAKTIGKVLMVLFALILVECICMA